MLFSGKKRREQLKLKRAVDRGDVPAPPPSKQDRNRKARRGPTGQLLGPPPPPSRLAAAESTRRLESSFVKLPPAFLHKTKALASTLPLPRPIPPELAILPDVDKLLPGAPASDGGQTGHLSAPRRPKWRYDMSKKELEANEQGLFSKWLAQTDAELNAWCNPVDVALHSLSSSSSAAAAHEAPGNTKNPELMPRAPTSYERNLEVWRQLWRVTEISQILLILLDSRCPTLHFPPALSAYLSGIPNASRLRTILVLTKVDISGPARANAWTKFLTARYPDTRVVQVESYVEKHPAAEGASNARKRMHGPHLPSAFRQTLVDALRATHAELLEPPAAIKNKPDKLAGWKPKIKSEVDWDAVLKAQGGLVGTAVGGAALPKQSATAPQREHQHLEDDENTQVEGDGSESAVLTIGLIGQPNVGKSSLLNALFGTQKVRASRTPGKTKHFQTLFWTPEVRLVDCPGLVIPNYVPMETQVLSGILPISRVSAIPLCIHHAARLLPLERILGLSSAHPSLAAPPPADKRTWRAGMRGPPGTSAGDAEGPVVWTAMDILTAYAMKKCWVTAKAGRPDVNRAGNAILRALAEGRIRWAFWPPGTDPETIAAHQRGADAADPDDASAAGAGIWVAHAHDDTATDEESEHELEHEDARPRRPAGSDEDPNEEDAEDDDGDDGDGEDEDTRAATRSGSGPVQETGQRLAATGGRFGALMLDDVDQGVDEAEEDDDSDISGAD